MTFDEWIQNQHSFEINEIVKEYREFFEKNKNLDTLLALDDLQCFKHDLNTSAYMNIMHRYMMDQYI